MAILSRWRRAGAPAARNARLTFACVPKGTAGTAFIIVGNDAPTIPSAEVQRLIAPDSVPYVILWPERGEASS